MKYLPYVMIVLLVMVVGCNPTITKEKVVYKLSDGYTDTTYSRPNDTIKLITIDHYQVVDTGDICIRSFKTDGPDAYYMVLSMHLKSVTYDTICYTQVECGGE